MADQNTSKAQQTAILTAHARRMARHAAGDWIIAPTPTVDACLQQGWAQRAEGVSGGNIARTTRAGLIASGVDMDAIHAEALAENDAWEARQADEQEADLNEQVELLEQPPAPGPVWTNGTADKEAVKHPHWCDRFHANPAPSGRTTHSIEILNTTVLDLELIDDVPLTVVLERVDEPGEPGQPRTVLSIGHALYQPTSVTIDGPTRAKLMAALLTAHALEQLEI